MMGCNSPRLAPCLGVDCAILVWSILAQADSTDLHNAGLRLPLVDQLLDGGKDLLHHHKHLQQKGGAESTISQVRQLLQGPTTSTSVSRLTVVFNCVSENMPTTPTVK